MEKQIIEKTLTTFVNCTDVKEIITEIEYHRTRNPTAIKFILQVTDYHEMDPSNTEISLVIERYETDSELEARLNNERKREEMRASRVLAKKQAKLNEIAELETKIAKLKGEING
jgi:hypothetical protein